MSVKKLYNVRIADNVYLIQKCRNFICKNHYSRKCPPGKIYFMLVSKSDNRQLVGVLQMGWPTARQQNNKYTYEIKRLVLLDEAPKNSESWFISKCLKYIKNYDQNIKVIITYADSRFGHTGVIYKASNFIYKGTNKPGGGTYIINGQEKHGRHVYKDIPKGQRNLATLKKVYKDVQYLPRSIKHFYIYKL